MFSLVSKFRRDVSGQALAEFVLVLPLLCLMLFGLVEIGLMLSSKQVVTYAAREGARAGALSNQNDQILGAVWAAVQYIDPLNEHTVVEIFPALETDPLRDRGNPLTVKVQYTYPLRIPFMSSDNFLLSSEAIVRMEK